MKQSPEAAPFAPAPRTDGMSSLNDAAARVPGRRLQEVARAAALDAEREAIADALSRYRWNRRKVAHHLQVSYKTLLSKMRACGLIW